MEENSDKDFDENNIQYDNVLETMDPEVMSIDQIIINLKIIALIKKHEKLSIREHDKSLIIDGKNNFLYIQSIKRWYNEDNRKKTMDYIEKIIHKTFEWMDQVYEDYKLHPDKKDDISEEIFEEDNEALLLRLSKEVINASEGLKNLRITYKQDSLVNSQIQLLLDKIKIKVDKINTALNVKWIIDKEYQSNSQYGE
jgi:hypothetical protein